MESNSKKYPFHGGDKHSHLKHLLLDGLEFDINKSDYEGATLTAQNFLWLYPDDERKIIELIMIYLSKAKDLFINNKYDEARRLIKTYLDFNPLKNEFYEEQAKKAIETNRFDDANIFLNILMHTDPEFERKICHLTINKIKEDIKDHILVENFLLQIGDNKIFLAFVLNKDSNEFYTLFKHIFGSGILYKMDYRRDKSGIIKIGTTERTNEVLLIYEGYSFYIIADSVSKSVLISIPKNRAINDMKLEDSKMIEIKGKIEKDNLKFNLEEYFADYIEELA